ncbi:MAG: SUMF1/EgtB/PvdO family nonheme iron enzyme [Spirochaetaceae bacterium]|jgi:hypothetical protein|nr:SUMF1/EgtB/PvdO family nonheme iron enzyme [Spirochaetaceae bacterium]
MIRKKKHSPVITKTLPEDQVHLPPLFGISPRLYLAVLYSCVLLVILFFILLYPGIHKPGTVFVITSEPQGAAVRIDDVYYDRSPCRVFVPKGTHTLTVLAPGFTAYQAEMQVDGRLFASLLFPLTSTFNLTLAALDPVAVLKDHAAEYARWSFAGEPTIAYQVPQSLSEGVYRIGRAEEPAFAPLLKSAARFATTKAAVRDLSRAQFLLDNAGNAPSPVTALHSAQAILSWLSETPQSAQWLATVLPEDLAETVRDSAWFKHNTQERIAPAPPAFEQGIIRLMVEDESLAFWKVQESAESLWWIAEEAVTPEQWAAFVSANPNWAREKSETLYAQGLVDTDYLESTDSTAITGVSWYAAQAYCQWLSTYLPAEQGLLVRLPTEAEWEFSLAVLPQRTSEWGEWCDDFFAPLNFLPAPLVIESPERVIRGGDTKTAARGSLPPEFCSPFVSFRPVIVKEGEEA